MLSIIISMSVGICVGFFVRKWRLKWIDSVILFVIWLLLFELGLEVGNDKQVLNSLPTLGLSALILATAALLGSVIAAYFLAKWIGLKKEDKSTAEEDNSPKKKSHPLKGSMIILAFFVAGILLGISGLIKEMPWLENVSFYTLAVLIFLVGLSIGHNKSVFTSLKSQDWRILLLPVFTIIGTLAACSLISLIPGYKLTECLAIGSGQAYYSLSSIIITQSLGIKLGTIALLSNIIRELMTLLCAPLIYKIFGPLAPIAAGGATTADTSLPIIRQVCGDKLSIISVYHGFLVDFSVPFLVTLFCSL